VVFTKYYLSTPVKENERSEASDMYGEEQKYMQLGKPEEK
jgi:hypothetical protein